VQDRAAVDGVLRQWVDAYQRLDVAAIRRVWPTAPTISFEGVKTYQLQLVNQQVSLNGDTARVTCVRQIAVQMAAGRSQSTSPRTVISLQRTPAGWIITGVQ
jgi:ketosteroid isomerase-like protein